MGHWLCDRPRLNLRHVMAERAFMLVDKVTFWGIWLSEEFMY